MKFQDYGEFLGYKLEAPVTLELGECGDKHCGSSCLMCPHNPDEEDVCRN